LTEEQKQPETLSPAMSIAQFKAITALLAGTYINTNATSKEVTTERLYVHSHYFGTTRFHTVSSQYDGDIIIDQTDFNKQYQQRITFDAAEIEPLLRQLLLWHFAKAEDNTKADDWDDKPFGDDPDLRHEDGPSEDRGTPDGGMVIFSLNDGSYSIAAERSSKSDDIPPEDLKEPFII
jgi:hypothetical protein